MNAITDETTDRDEHEPSPPGFAAKTIYAIAAVAIVALLFLHTVKWNRVQVDYTSALLLGLLILLPLAHYIRRLKIAGLEAEIDRTAVRKLRSKASDLPTVTATSESMKSDDLSILDLVAADPPLGLAKLRIDLEKELRKRFEVLVERGVVDGRPNRPGTASYYVRELRAVDDLPPEVVSPLLEVLNLANRAIHGEYVRSDDATEIARVGVRLLDVLRAPNEL